MWHQREPPPPSTHSHSQTAFTSDGGATRHGGDGKFYTNTEEGACGGDRDSGVRGGGSDQGGGSHSDGGTSSSGGGEGGGSDVEERLAFTLGDGRAGVLSVRGRHVADARAKRPVSSGGQVCVCVCGWVCVCVCVYVCVWVCV